MEVEPSPAAALDRMNEDEEEQVKKDDDDDAEPNNNKNDNLDDDSDDDNNDDSSSASVGRLVRRAMEMQSFDTTTRLDHHVVGVDIVVPHDPEQEEEEEGRTTNGHDDNNKNDKNTKHKEDDDDESARRNRRIEKEKQSDVAKDDDDHDHDEPEQERDNDVAIVVEEDCYRSLPSFHDYREICDPAHYLALPPDWYVIVTDVAGSTQFVESGRYRDVNTVGAMPIAAVRNALGNDDFPYVFGGDGATLVVRPHQRAIAIAALLAVQKLVQVNYDMHLRVGGVTVATLRQVGANVKVAKFAIAPGTIIALFSGRGLSVADEMVKNGTADDVSSSIFSPPRGNDDSNNDPATAAVVVNEPNLTGLSCRWNRVPNRNGCVLSLLVVSTSRTTTTGDSTRTSSSTTTTKGKVVTMDDDHNDYDDAERKIYQEVLERLSHIIALNDEQEATSIISSTTGSRPNSIISSSGGSSNPANMDLAQYKTAGQMIREERRLHGRNKHTWIYFGSLAWWNRLIEILLCHVLFHWRILQKTNLLDVPTYKKRMRAHADYRKFDDMIRMVVDCSEQQVVLIRAFLDDLHQQGKICYGLHQSEHSLLTCLIADPQKGQHVHFVDGDAGGYTLAAKQLKSQLKTAREERDPMVGRNNK